MLPRTACTFLVLVGAASTAVLSASAGRASSTPAPPLTSFALASSDFRSGGVILSQSTSKQGGMSTFIRTFRPGARLSGAPLLSVVSLVMLEPDAETAAADFTDLNGTAQSIRGRDAIGKAFAESFVQGWTKSAHAPKLTVRKTVVGRPTMFGESSLHLPVRLATNRGTFPLAVEVTQIDRVISIVYLAGQIDARVSSADSALARSLSRQHATGAFAVGSAAPPTISGAAGAGQTLAIDEGTWTGSPTRFDYAWARCDASGASCVAIEGATARTYVPTAADAGFTIRAAVTAANSVSSLQATSSATTPIVR